jgi:hypothetical protein
MGKDMKQYNDALEAAIKGISKEFDRKQTMKAKSSRDTKFNQNDEKPSDMNDFELITWLIIK